ncbi:MAG: hypothetical protein JWM87_861 [Candidatus Eremiobacteraeota bacterium]|nr:hypothetical protein [Candidatus Eremiobacteraeota bacterium]
MLDQATLSPFEGPLHDVARRVLVRHPEHAMYRAGVLSASAYYAFVDRIAPELVAAGVPACEVHFAKRYPRDPELFVREALARLAHAGIVPDATPQRAGAASAMEHAAQYDHGGYGTFIYPEEALLLSALAAAWSARSAVFLGSYYGYWASCVAAEIVTRGGRAVLVDPDPHANAVARRNHARYGDAVRVETATGAEFLAAANDTFDLVVIDAELPRSHPDPDEAGKAIYRGLLRDVLPHCAPRAHFVFHNILFEDVTGDAYLAGIVARNERELGRFRAVAARELDTFVELASTEGVGVGVRLR